MKHDLEAFSRDIVSLIKTSGDTGDSGDKSRKSLQHSENFVPTARADVSPLDLKWGQHVSASGDRKAEYSQSLESGVPTVPTVATHFQWGTAVEALRHFPPEWYAILAKLNDRDPVDGFSMERWRLLLCDGESFLSKWGQAAFGLGWTALDLFGVHPAAPAARMDVLGLIMTLSGGEVVNLTVGSATMRRRSGAVLTFRRVEQAGAILMSEVRS
ncbi:hypothetical protein [Tardiphaga sp. P5_C7]